MALWTWWWGDAIPMLAPIPGLTVKSAQDRHGIAKLTSLDIAEVASRLDSGHRMYVAALQGVPVAYGWVAMVSAEIGELSLQFEIPAGDRYLWDFATLPAWRGRGIYPRLLQAILAHEAEAGRRFWIIHAPENGASAAGIRKAGFRPVSELSFLPQGIAASQAVPGSERAPVGARLLGVSLLDVKEVAVSLSACWRCFSEIRDVATETKPSCGCTRPGPEHACTCTSSAESPAARLLAT